MTTHTASSVAELAAEVRKQADQYAATRHDPHRVLLHAAIDRHGGSSTAAGAGGGNGHGSV